MRTIAHTYDTYDEAVRVVNALEAAGVPHDNISLVSGDKSRAATTTGTTAGDTGDAASTGAGTGATLGTVLGGGAGLLAGIGALAIPGIGPIVAAGWLVATLAGAGVGAAAGGLLGSLTGAGVSEADAQTYTEHVGRGGTLITVRADDMMAGRVEQIMKGGPATMTTGMAPAAMTGAAAMPAATTATMNPAPAATTARTAGTDEVIPVVKENLVVGKREVEKGEVRVTSHVVETPVQEQVTLHDERVVVERHPVNQPLTGAAANAFQERTIEATARGEEAVVGKEARVVEEIGIHKEATERTETVRDTVRETRVDVENAPGTVNTGTTGVGTVGTTGTGVAGSVDRTLNTNVSGTNPGASAPDGTPGNPPGTMTSRAVDKTLGTNISGANPGRK